jgi:hypothetical protein
MNKVFKSVWSEALGAWVAASKLTRGRGKGGGKVARAVALVVVAFGAGSAYAGSGLSLGGGAGTADATNPTDIAFGSGATYRSRDGAWLINGALSVTPHGDTGARAQVGYEF